MKSLPIFGPILGLLKVLCIALILATILFALVRPFALKKVKTIRLFFGCFAICLLSWTLWITSYWGDTGYYDSFRIPLGNNKEISGAFGQGSVEINNVAFQQEFTAFALTDSIVYGMLDKGTDTTYIIYPIAENSAISYRTYSDYLNNTTHPKPLSIDRFKSPEENYHEYWGKLLWLY